jgi:hypothetical protein
LLGYNPKGVVEEERPSGSKTRLVKTFLNTINKKKLPSYPYGRLFSSDFNILTPVTKFFFFSRYYLQNFLKNRNLSSLALSHPTDKLLNEFS